MDKVFFMVAFVLFVFFVFSILTFDKTKENGSFSVLCFGVDNTIVYEGTASSKPDYAVIGQRLTFVDKDTNKKIYIVQAQCIYKEL